ncbi:ATP-dependent helicase fft3 [Pseudocercospora fuligena]|uniref:ATP-dependent helicase fft3 n=1 Tax=Pseudocercospora fuligena TaxID=685502 RepID=A0A8H6RS53_9PEZI|nr:ATP-dependent helicase fft3 [Pseudocercospora fuligena]
MDRLDPIEDTPAKRRKLVHTSDLNNEKAWNSQDDDEEQFTENDFQTAATLPISNTQKRQLQYSPAQLHADLNTSSAPQRPPSQSSYITQPTQTLNQHVTQPTQPMRSSSDVQVPRSSPSAPSPQRPAPAPMMRAPFAKPPSSLLASAMAPPGTAFRRPPNVQPKPTPVNLDDSDDDPPVQHSDDEPKQSFSTNLKPTSFKRAGPGPNASPAQKEERIRDSPQQVPFNKTTPFMAMLSSFNYKQPVGPARPADDMASAYGSASRPPRPQQLAPRQPGPARAMPVGSPNMMPMQPYHSLFDIQDHHLRGKVLPIQQAFPHFSISQINNTIIEVDSDNGEEGEGDSGVVEDAASDFEEEAKDRQKSSEQELLTEQVQEMREERLLKMLNDCTVHDLSELTAKPEEMIKFVLDKRPFNTLDEVRDIVQETLTKTGKKSKKTKAVGDQLVEECMEVMSGYDAVDELVVRCEKLAQPLREALKGWGVGEMDGELQLMKLEEAHDSGIGTPASSTADDNGPQKTDYYAQLLEDAQRFFAEKNMPGAKKNAKNGSSNVIMALRKAAIHPLLSRRIYDDKKIDKMVAALKKTDEFGENTTEKIRSYINGDAAISLKAESAQVEKQGEKMVEDMLAEQLVKKEDVKEEEKPAEDLKDAFAKGLAGEGVDVKSKQAQF